MKKENPIQSRNEPARGWVFQTGIVSLALLVLLCLMVWNTASLKHTLTFSAEDYVTDVSRQLSSDISSRMESYQRQLKLLADSLSALPANTVEDRLQEQAQILNFDALILIDHSNIPPSYLEDEVITYVDGQDLLFSVPMKKGERVDQVLAGICKKERIQELIQPKSYAGAGLTCIVDSSGSVVISPTDLKPFLQLDNIFRSGESSTVRNNITAMNEDLSRRQSGVFQFTAVDETPLILSYQVLDVNDWSLLTLVPADLISGKARAYLFHSFLIVGGIICVFVLFLVSLLQFYLANRRYLEQIAFVDPLTGGMNEAAFQLAYRSIATAMLPEAYTIVFLNIRQFNLVNESLGFQAGNEILRQVHRILKEHLHPGELVARCNTDQFFLCLKEGDCRKTQVRLNHISETVGSIPLKNTHYYLTFHQGACRVDEPGLDIANLQDRARMAAKLQSQPSSCSFYSADMMTQMKRDQELNALFGPSLEHHDFQVYLQPKVRLPDNSTGGAEALVRWMHPHQGLISPSDFIPLLEKNGRICQLDLYVFEEVCRFLARWQEEGRQLLPISVNLSRAHLRNPQFLDAFSALKERYGVPDGILEIELTESMFLDDRQRELAKDTIHHIHERGFLCSLDDFGVGFSSLALLKDLEVDAVKLDRQFFTNMDSPKSQIMISGLISLVNTLGIHTVAEGIESPEQVDFLRRSCCDMVQGYVFSKPLSICDFEHWKFEQQDMGNLRKNGYH